MKNFLVAVFILIVLIVTVTKCNSCVNENFIGEEKNPTEVSFKKPVVENYVPPVVKYKDKQEEAECTFNSSITGMDDLMKNYKKYDNEIIFTTIEDAAAVYVRHGKDQSPEFVKLRSKLKSKIIVAHTVVFPLLRKRYTEEMRQKLWEENVKVYSNGKTINFVGGIFANNKAIKQSYEAAYPQLIRYRFKRANFKYIEDYKYTFFAVGSKKDSDI